MSKVVAAGGRAAAPARALWRKVGDLVAPWRPTLALVAVCIVASSLAELVPAFVVRHVVNHNLVPHRTAGLLLAAVV